MISIHALCEEGDKTRNPNIFPKKISIHALCEEGDLHLLPVPRGLRISIHALCEEGDARPSRSSSPASGFLSTPSARRATSRDHADQRLHHISIHALCEEGDQMTLLGPGA